MSTFLLQASAYVRWLRQVMILWCHLTHSAFLYWSVRTPALPPSCPISRWSPSETSGNLVLLWICILVLAVAIISLAFFCVPKWGGKFIERISRRLYNREGNVLISVPETIKKKQWVGYVVAMVFGSCVFISVLLGCLGYLSIKYMQPVSALYVVPFLVFLYLWQRPIISTLALLWPTLYAIHAILVVAGVPIQFGGPLVFLNMLIPVAGYGILCGLLGHVYSRYASKKLKTAAHLQENTNEQ